MIKNIYETEKKNDNINNVCCVSGYWTIKNKINSNNYTKNFKYTLPLICDFIFFTDEKNFQESAQNIRTNLKSTFINLKIKNFYSFKYKEYLTSPQFIHPAHCPSIELWLIWCEKIHLLKISSEISNYEWYCWYDAGLAKYRKRRDNLPTTKWPNEQKMDLLQKNKINVTHKSDKYICGTSYIIHRDFIIEFHKMFYDVIDEYIIQKKNLDLKLKNNGNFESITDQTILTYLYINNPDKFNILLAGFGANIDYLA